jgi:ribose transport system substrate-binding protein
MAHPRRRSKRAAGSLCVLVLGTAAAVGACGSSSSTGQNAGPSSSAAATSSAAGTSSAAAGESLTIGGVVFNPADPYWISMKCGAQTEAKKLGVTLNWQAAPTPEVAPESTALQSVSVTNPDGIMLAPASPTAFVAPVQSLMRKGTPVAIVDSSLASTAGLENVLTDHGKDGAILAPVIAKAIGPHGTLGLISDKPGAPGALARYQSVLSLLHQHYPGIKVLPIQYDQDDSSAVAAQIAQSMIRGNPSLSGIYAINGPMGIGVASGVQAANATGKVKVFAFDSTPQEVTGVRNGTFTAIMGQSPFLEGATSVKALVSYLRAHSTKGAVSPASPYVVHTPVKLIDKANVNLPTTKTFFYSASC